MRIMGLVSHLDHVSGRYRLQAYRPYWQRAGLSLELLRCPRTLLSGWWWDRKLRHADVVILQRRLLSPWRLHHLRDHAQRLVFDFDDALFLHDSYDPRGLQSEPRLHGFKHTLHLADAVVAGNGFLRDQASLHVGDDRVTHIPTCVDPGKYPLAGHANHRPLRLVWIGSSSTLQGLEKIRPLLERLGQALPGTRLKIVCDRPLRLQHLPVDFVPWSEATEARELADADIGISWLPGDWWSLGKCGLKVLQYMAAGLPVVVNPIGVQAQLVQPGENGCHAQSEEEWIAAIARLGSDPGLRRRMGLKGRQRVENEFHVQRGAQAWVELLTRLQRREKPANASYC